MGYTPTHKNPSQEEHHATDEELLARAIPIDLNEDEGEAAEGSGEAVEHTELDTSEEELEQAARNIGMLHHRKAVESMTPIEIEEEEAAAKQPARKISAIGEKQSSQIDQSWKRHANRTGQGATHCRTFVSKLRYDAIEHLDQQVNEWLDEHPDYEVKFATTAVGPLIGKLKEDCIFMTVWV